MKSGVLTITKKGRPLYCKFEDEFEDFKKSRVFYEIFKRHKIIQH